MIEPSDLSMDLEDLSSVPRGLDLVVAIHGFVDAGQAAEAAAAAVLDTLPHRPVVAFDTDLLIDHRSRRPRMLFNEDRVEEYLPHSLSLLLVEDDAGAPFLLLTGPEPDWLWERFTDRLLELLDELEVASTTIITSIGMPVPHTRPLTTTVSGNRADLIEQYSAWRPVSSAPASVIHRIEHRLHPQSPVATFTVLVPHYVGESGSAGPALTALEGVTSATGLAFRTEELRQADREFQQLVAQQMETNEELQRVVTTLEARYDAFMAQSSVRSPLTDEDGSVPSADEIAEELERYLRERRGGDGDRLL
ncbi:PAC2 family protein [Agrococcus sp. SL85]|uniref:PAC2 family protein n=1 Tax=Agrococcus sp. SL85 TaxID=2995141 RepID=UPI00226D1595|nr:PAC2 family protein [Agrococcus sp. SL85]WAC65781.1 PAC2 family protein [Agrococcus sp. SL85]